MQKQSNMPYAIEVQNIVKTFGPVIATNQVSFKVKKGEIHALLGENGAGKSTLMSILYGLYRPDSGILKIDGEVVSFKSPKEAAQKSIGMVHQNFQLVSTLTAFDNILMGLPESWWRGRNWRFKKVKEIESLAKEYGLSFEVERAVWQMSHGEKQRVEIFKALYRQSDIIILDEPTSVLTPQESDDLYRTLKKLKETGKTIVLTTHKLREVMHACDHISIMRKGKMVASMPSSETNERDLARKLMGEMPVEVRRIEKSESSTKPSKNLLELQEICAKGLHGEQALNDLSLFVYPGEIVGVAGVAGNGQKQLAEIITGMQNPTSGGIKFKGKWINHSSIKGMIDIGIAHVPEDRLHTGMAGSLDAVDNLLMKDYKKEKHSNLGIMKHSRNLDWAKSIINNYDVTTPSANYPVRLLSGGNQQKLLLAREIEGDPALLVANHPTQGLDVGATASVHNLLLDMRSRDRGVLLISEDLDEILKISDRILVIYQGMITGEFEPSKATREEIGLYMTGSKTQFNVGALA
ncbi:ABC transporter ATP-binding protein [Colwellia sp. E2M01]|uniref:ABC transporter ATP-binding protein n=1 Tax=Colwellia sp. E2M01 TaxID=2841561 RepID=UPI001C084AAA|nr:ABC transporter ATP-binding protein [Colwellia sp. E2M01]MBU2870657.1 ABC transporter ATP-binding protein [Colwellia sp. E2M01]